MKKLNVHENKFFDINIHSLGVLGVLILKYLYLISYYLKIISYNVGKNYATGANNI